MFSYRPVTRYGNRRMIDHMDPVADWFKHILLFQFTINIQTNAYKLRDLERKLNAYRVPLAR